MKLFDYFLLWGKASCLFSLFGFAYCGICISFTCDPVSAMYVLINLELQRQFIFMFVHVQIDHLMITSYSAGNFLVIIVDMVVKCIQLFVRCMFPEPAIETCFVGIDLENAPKSGTDIEAFLTEVKFA